jgi:hypothetical protein
MATFRLKLENAYWSKGFFNVTVDYERFITMTEGPIEIYLGDARVTRSMSRSSRRQRFGSGVRTDERTESRI